MSKTRSSLEQDYSEADGDFEYAACETLQDKRAKNRRQTEIRRRMENKLERRRLSEQLGMYLDELELDDDDYITASAVNGEATLDEYVDPGLSDDDFAEDLVFSREYTR